MELVTSGPLPDNGKELQLKLLIVDEQDVGTQKFLSLFSYREILETAFLGAYHFFHSTKTTDDVCSDFKSITLVLNPRRLHLGSDAFFDPSDQDNRQIHLSTPFVLELLNESPDEAKIKIEIRLGHEVVRHLRQRHHVGLQTIPGELIAMIAGVIKSWAMVDGNLENRRKAKAQRDAALRAVALASWETYKSMIPHLLENVSVSLLRILDVVTFFCRDHPLHADGVKTFEITGDKKLDKEGQIKGLMEICQFSDFPPTAEPKVRVEDGARNLITSILEQLPNLEELIIDQNFGHVKLMFIQGQQISIPSFGNSLRKIYLSSLTIRNVWNHDLILSARNILWILAFSPNLRTAAFAFSISTNDLRFLSDHCCAFKGASNIKDLALAFCFVFDPNNKATYWHQNSRVGNLKNQAISNLLTVTKQLDALEFHVETDQSFRSPDDDTELDPSCLSSLVPSSSKTLKHLRLFGLEADGDDLDPIDYTPFSALKILSFNGFAVFYFQKDLILPPNLEVLCLVFYLFDSNGTQEDQFQEEEYLVDFLRDGSFPNLKEVIVPSLPLIATGETQTPSKVWIDSRSALRELEIFKTGKVKLLEVESGYMVGNPAKGETCFSFARWISPW